MPFIKAVFIIYLLSFSGLVFSQNRQNLEGGNGPAIGKIKGLVIDEKNKQAIEFATVALFKLKDSALAGGMVAGSKGEFQLSELPFGRYFLKINFSMIHIP